MHVLLLQILQLVQVLMLHGVKQQLKLVLLLLHHGGAQMVFTRLLQLQAMPIVTQLNYSTKMTTKDWNWLSSDAQ